MNGFEIMRTIRRGYCICLEIGGITGEVRLVSKLFGLPA